MTLEPVTEGRHPVRVAAPAIESARPAAAPATRDPRAAADRRAEVERRTYLGLTLGYVALRAIAVGGMLLVAYLAVAQAWIPATTDAVLAWYTSTIAPYLAIDPVVPQLPVGDGVLFSTATTPSFVLGD
ncbi:MAG: hypothetical protein ACK4MD_07705 [Demequina sp.]